MFLALYIVRAITKFHTVSKDGISLLYLSVYLNVLKLFFSEIIRGLNHHWYRAELHGIACITSPLVQDSAP